MELDINFLKQIAIDVFDAINPILGSREAAIKFKRGAGGDISMNIDLLAEDIIINSLKKTNTDLLLISEELGEKYIGDEEKAKINQNILVVDPLDGSNNAVRGIPYCSVSIAYAIGDMIHNIKKAVVLDLNTKDIYWAEKGKGAFFNDSKIHVSDVDILQNCFFELNFSMNNFMENLIELSPMIKRFYRVRVLGSTALTMCLIAKGSIEAFINLRKSNRLVDIAAGILILKEAGGKFFPLIGNIFEEKLSINLRFPFIACNHKLESFLKKEFILKKEKNE